MREVILIPDAELDEYLKDKILTKPDYGIPTEKTSTVISDYIKRMEAERKERDRNNKSTKKGYRL